MRHRTPHPAHISRPLRAATACHKPDVTGVPQLESHLEGYGRNPYADAARLGMETRARRWTILLGLCPGSVACHLAPTALPRRPQPSSSSRRRQAPRPLAAGLARRSGSPRKTPWGKPVRHDDDLGGRRGRHVLDAQHQSGRSRLCAHRHGHPPVDGDERVIHHHVTTSPAQCADTM